MLAAMAARPFDAVAMESEMFFATITIPFIASRPLENIFHALSSLGSAADRPLPVGTRASTDRASCSRPAGGVLHRDAKARVKFRADFVAHHGIRRSRHHHRGDFLLGRIDGALPLRFAARL